MRFTFLTMVILPAMLAAAPVPKNVTTAPFPMTVGDMRVYEWRTADKSTPAYTNTITKVELQKDGSNHVTVRREPPRGPAKTILIAVSETGISRVVEGDQVQTEPELLLKLPAKVGTTWEASGTKHEVMAEENVTVPAGEYNAAKVAMITSPTDTTTLWFAPGVGLVRMAHSGHAQVLELKSFTPGK
jgi:hypothetical protein